MPPRKLDRASTGVPGLDDVLQGGIPRKSLFLVEGRPGSGKTTIALQFLLQGIRNGETCLLVSNAETPSQLKSIAETHGWSLDDIEIMEWREPTGTEEHGLLDYTLFPEAEVEVGETLQNLFAEIERLQPTLLVIDSISALRVLAPTAGFYRRQLRRIRDFLAARSCTTMVLDEAAASEKDRRSQTLADGILELDQIDLNYGSDRRRMRVRKLRGSGFVSGAHDFTIKSGGVLVYPRLIAQSYSETSEVAPLLSGISELDSLTGSGLPRGSSTLIMGPAGIGKSSISTVYAMAAANRGERASLLLFDESVETHITRSQGLGYDTRAMMDAGNLLINHLDPAELTAGQIANLLVQQVEQENIKLVVIDTLNGYLQSASEEPAVLLHLRELISYLGRRGIVTLLTLTQHGILGPVSEAPIDVSFLADNVILLRYYEVESSIRQALSVVKKRTGQHERSIRELIMKPGVIEVSEPLNRFTGVLTGTPQYTGTVGSTGT